MLHHPFCLKARHSRQAGVPTILLYTVLGRSDLRRFAGLHHPCKIAVLRVPNPFAESAPRITYSIGDGPLICKSGEQDFPICRRIAQTVGYEIIKDTIQFVRINRRNYYSLYNFSRKPYIKGFTLLSVCLQS